jgi:hypothetical protein
MILYHFTHKKNLESIDRQGLTPAITGNIAPLTYGVPVVWLTAKPSPTWLMGIPDDGTLFMLTVDAKRGKHLHRWVPWFTERAVDLPDPATGKVRRYYGEEMMAVINADPADGPFVIDRKTDKENYYICTAVIHRKRIIGCAQVRFVGREIKNVA